MPYWLVTMFDEHKRKEQFHVGGDTVMEALRMAAEVVLFKNGRFEPVEAHVQLIENKEGKIK